MGVGVVVVVSVGVLEKDGILIGMKDEEVSKKVEEEDEEKKGEYVGEEEGYEGLHEYGKE